MSVGICVGSVECSVLFVSVSATFMQTAAGMRTFDPELEYLCYRRAFGCNFVYVVGHVVLLCRTKSIVAKIVAQ